MPALDPNEFFYSRFAQPGFLLAVSMGLVPGFSFVEKFGHNPLITTASDPEDIWQGGGLYNFSTGQSIDTLSCATSADVGRLIVIGGIENDTATGNTPTGEKQSYAITNGQNKVNFYENPDLSGAQVIYKRVNRAFNDSDESIGNITTGLYIYENTAIVGGIPTDTTKIRAKIQDGDNQTQQAIYTVPPGKVGFAMRGEVGLIFTGTPSQLANYARLVLRARNGTKVFRTIKVVSALTAASSSYIDGKILFQPVSSMTDIKLTVEEVSSDMGVWGTFDVLIVNEDRLPAVFLAGIGQPGY